MIEVKKLLGKESKIPGVYVYDNSNKKFNFEINIGNDKIQSTPSFIQSPWNDWNCYNAILKKNVILYKRK